MILLIKKNIKLSCIAFCCCCSSILKTNVKSVYTCPGRSNKVYALKRSLVMVKIQIFYNVLTWAGAICKLAAIYKNIIMVVGPESVKNEYCISVSFK